MIELNRPRAIEIFSAGVSAADPEKAVAVSLRRNPLASADGRLIIIAIGKAARGMAKAAMHRLPVAKVLVVTTAENARPLQGATVIAGAHPGRDESSIAAGQAVIEALADTRATDQVLVLVSGGGSALMVAPSAGLSLADKAAVNELLIGSGLDITTMNMVRQKLSRLKGGGLSRQASPARVTALILSDVVDDDLRAVASGPTTAPIGSLSEVRAVLKTADIWLSLPQTVRRVLERGDQAIDVGTSAENRLIGSNAISVAAMRAEEPTANVATQALIGDVQDAAALIARSNTSGVWLWGGETTVRLKGDGLGGRNQELALRVALKAERLNWPAGWVFLSGGTDGRDGPTDAAGGLVDSGTLARMRAAGFDPVETLENNDSYHALQAAGDLLIIGATGTNVADLQVLIRP
ncbi:MAG: glycerate kinase type-2 family protein [Paracoccaceae bacterium]